MATVENPVIFHGIALARDTRDSLLENLLFWIHVGKKTWDKQVAGEDVIATSITPMVRYNSARDPYRLFAFHSGLGFWCNLICRKIRWDYFCFRISRSRL